MSHDAFYWIGLITSAVVICLAVMGVLFALYAYLIHRRFGLIFFRKGECRLSLASWHNTRLSTATKFGATDWPIGKRPFILTYKLKPKLTLFIMFGTMSSARYNAVEGIHPEEEA
jgi:hypothetical protein